MADTPPATLQIRENGVGTLTSGLMAAVLRPPIHPRADPKCRCST